MGNDPLDVLVVGGGIQGAGVLQALAAAGYSACLLERRELACGTSSRSSKLIHGGLRYLETLQLALVRESLREREILLRIAPKLVHWLPFYLPIYRSTRRRPLTVRAGLALYAALAGRGERHGWSSVPRSEWGALDGLSTAGLEAVLRYHDAQTDDAQLVRAVARSARSLGAGVELATEFVSARPTSNGWEARSHSTSGERLWSARALVNAAGPWAAEVQRRIASAPVPPAVELIAGTHIELPQTLVHGAYYAEAPADRRAVFVLPWKGHTLVGTTERAFAGDPASVQPTAQEIEYLRQTFSGLFPARSSEVQAAWAGLRVLPAAGGRAAFSRSREALYLTGGGPPARVVSVFGGKLTGYRASALKVVRLLEPALGPRRRSLDSAELVLEPD